MESSSLSVSAMNDPDDSNVVVAVENENAVENGMASTNPGDKPLQRNPSDDLETHCSRLADIAIRVVLTL